MEEVSSEGVSNAEERPWEGDLFEVAVDEEKEGLEVVLGGASEGAKC